MEEELVEKLGGREAFERARGTPHDVPDARGYLNARRNLGHLYAMMSEIESDPRAVLAAKMK
jgi:hypothetical protein